MTTTQTAALIRQTRDQLFARALELQAAPDDGTMDRRIRALCDQSRLDGNIAALDAVLELLEPPTGR